MVKNHYGGSPSVETRVGQGYEIGRPSTLYLKAGRNDGEIVVNVGGRISEVASGIWKA
jgi:trans-2,3-dihydro-3-hydroxyanthranilate isomerase